MRKYYSFGFVFALFILTGLQGQAQVFFTETFNSPNPNWSVGVNQPTPDSIQGLRYTSGDTAVNQTCNNYWTINSIHVLDSATNQAFRGVCPNGAYSDSSNKSLHITFQPSAFANGALNPHAENAGEADAYSYYNDAFPNPMYASSDQYAYINQDISTIGRSDIELNFWAYIGGDQSNTLTDRSVLYSVDGGTTWKPLIANISYPPSQHFLFGSCTPWSQYSAVLPADAENIPNLRIAFRWRNNNIWPITSADYSPNSAFNIDNITLSEVQIPVQADFRAPKLNICNGDTLTFINNSTTGSGVNYQWSVQPSGFSFVSSSADTSFQPSITFTTDTVFDVELIVSHPSGTSDTLTYTDYITVTSGCNCGIDTTRQTLWSEDFEGTNYKFTLNNNSNAPIGPENSTMNTWVVNNTYTGGTVTTPSQTYKPNTNTQYMHVANTGLGILNATYFYLGFGDLNTPFTISDTIDTRGFDNVALDFWWLCSGGAGAYGEFYIRDAAPGSTWFQLNPIFMWNQSTWTNRMVAPAPGSVIANIMDDAQFFIGYYMVIANGTDPALALDDFTVTGTPIAAPSSNPTVSISGTDTICAGSSGSFSSTITNLGGATVNYQWQVNGQDSSGATNASFNPTALQDGDIITLSATIDSCAYTSNALTISVQDTLQPSISIQQLNPQVCQGDSVLIEIQQTTYLTDSAEFQVIVNGLAQGAPTRDSIISVGNISDGDQLALRSSSTVACAVPDSAVSNALTISTRPKFKASLSLVSINPADSTACAGGTLSMTIDTNNAGNNPTIRWSVKNQRLLATDSLSLSVDSIRAGDTLIVFLIPTQACFRGDTLEIPLGNAAPYAYGLNVSQITCAGSQDGAAQLIFSDSTAITNLRYVWTDSATGQVEGQGRSISNLAAGSYALMVEDTLKGCTQSTYFTINDPGSPLSANVQRIVAASCTQGGRVEFDISGGLPPYFVYTGTDTAQVDTAFAGLSGGSYTFFIQDTRGCILQIDTMVPGYGADGDTLSLLINSELVSCPGSQDGLLRASTTNGTPPYAYSWLNYPDTDSLLTGLDTGSYTAFVEDAAGCTASVSVRLGSDSNAFCDLIIYEGFSPNGDNANDTWVIDGVEFVPENDMYIYNRWGDLVWNVSSYNNSGHVWEGINNKGKEVTNGTYYYVFTYEYEGEEITRSGWVYVAR